MKADDLYEVLKPNLKRLGRTEKIKLYHQIISESHPAYRLKKRGKIKSCEEVKQKLRKDLRIASQSALTIHNLKQENI